MVNEIRNFVYHKPPADAHDRKRLILLLRSKCGRRNVNAKTKRVLSFTIKNMEAIDRETYKNYPDNNIASKKLRHVVRKKYGLK